MIRLERRIPTRQLEWRNDPQIRPWLRENQITSLEDQKRWEESLIGDLTRQFFAVVHEDQDVGTVGLSDIHYPHGTAEFSLLIGPEFQRNGYGKEALTKIVGYGFIDLNLNLIWGETYENNPAMRMYEEVGFVKEATLRQRFYKCGKRIDSRIYSITQKEFRERFL